MPEQVIPQLPDLLGDCKPGTRALIETMESIDCHTRGYRADYGTVLGRAHDGRIGVKMDHGVTWYLKPTRILDVDRYVLP